MAKTVFENLRVYQLAEELADLVGEVVTRWDRLAQDTIIPKYFCGLVAPRF